MKFLTESKPAFKLCLFATALTMVVVVLGAFTRLVDAGLGCPDWPGCYGHFWAPTTDQAIANANQAYPDMPVDLSKTWPEMVHRYFASSLGLVIIAICVVCLKAKKQFPQQPMKLPLLLLALVILQGLFGMWTVTLKLWPQVVTAHLLGGFTTAALLWLLTLRLSGWNPTLQDQSVSSIKHSIPKELAMVVLGLVAIQIFLGGWTTSNYAAIACPDFPTCQMQWIPEANFSQGFNLLQQIGPNYLGGQLDADSRVAIHFSHRIGAIIAGLGCYFLAWRLWQTSFRRLAISLAVMVTVQIGLGISNIIFFLPLTVAVLHNAGGALLVLVLVTVNYQLYSIKSDKSSLSQLVGEAQHV